MTNRLSQSWSMALPSLTLRGYHNILCPNQDIKVSVSLILITLNPLASGHPSHS